MDAAVARATRIAELPGPPRLPLLGNAHLIKLPHFHEQLEEWRRQYGDAYRVKVWEREFVVMGDPQVASEALRDRPGTFGRTERVVQTSLEMHFGGLFSSNGEKWRRQRSMVMAAFDPGHVRRYFPALVQVAHRLADRWTQAAAQGRAIPLQPDLMRYTVDVICGLAFGRDMNTLQGDEDILQKHMERIFPMFFRRIFAPFAWWHFVKLPSDRRLDADLAAFRAAVQDFIAAARERMRQDPALREAPGNLIEAMIAKRDQPDNALDDEDVAANVATMLLAGEDTTANTLAWLVHLLSRHPQALARATEEVRAALGGDRVPTQLEQLDAMPFVEACAHETMRLKPVAPIMPQQAARDTVLAGVAIPAGTICIFLMRGGTSDPAHFKHPEAFRPERWLGEDAGTAKRISMPFGAGPRMCPGRYLALLEIKMAMATLLGSFDIEAVTPTEGTEVRERLAFTMTPTGMAMRLALRRS